MPRQVTNPPELHPAPVSATVAEARGTRLVYFAGQVALDPPCRPAWVVLLLKHRGEFVGQQKGSKRAQSRLPNLGVNHRRTPAALEK